MNEMRFDLLTIDRPLERIARLTLNSPPVNALSRAMTREIQAAADWLAQDRGLSVVLVTATGKAFCAGADLKERRGLSEPEVIEAVRGISGAAQALADIPVPTIALVQGAALGGGYELALACDLRIAAASASIGLPECSLAIIPGAGGTQRLPRLVGLARARRWIYSARVGTAEEALRDGLLDEVVSADELMARGLAVAQSFTRCGPLALRAAKQAIEGGLSIASLSGGLSWEWSCYETILPTRDRREALAAFAEKRAPHFTGE